jgi:hypothetical protein
MLTFVRSMMEWLGGTVSTEDVGGEGGAPGSKNAKKKRDDNPDDDALGAFALRFKYETPIFPRIRDMLILFIDISNFSKAPKPCSRNTLPKTPSLFSLSPHRYHTALLELYSRNLRLYLAT